MGTSMPTGCAYELDADLRILSVDPSWSDFARTNDAPELVPPGPLGKLVLACIADPASEHLYKRLFETVLRTGRTIVVPIRCDSPTQRRFLELKIEPREPAGLRIVTSLTRVEPRLAVALIDGRATHGEEHLRMCGWCKSVDVGGRWCEVEEAVRAMGLFQREVMPAVTHGICPACYERVIALIDEPPP